MLEAHLVPGGKVHDLLLVAEIVSEALQKERMRQYGGEPGGWCCCRDAQLLIRPTWNTKVARVAEGVRDTVARTGTPTSNLY